MKHKPVQWGWPPKAVRASWHPIRSIGDFFGDLTDEDKKLAKWVARNASYTSRPDIITEIAVLKRRAEENAALTAFEERLKKERDGKD